MKEAPILFFDQISRGDVPLVGGKNANLGEMITKTKVPVPFGFAVTAAAYRHFLEKNSLQPKMDAVLAELTDPNDTKKLKEVGSRVRSLIRSASMPPDLEADIKSAYAELGKRLNLKEPFVAVRSSATAEDLPGASFAGQQETYLNVRGAQDTANKVRECFASLYTDRAIFYRIEKGFEHRKVALSCAVQLMVASRAAGVVFTLDVRDGNMDVMTIEGSWGLGEFVVKGTITPDDFFVRKSDLEIVERHVAKKHKMLVRLPQGGTVEKTVPHELQDKPALSDGQVRELAGYCLALERHYNFPQDVEWALDDNTGRIMIVQTRPETAWVEKKRKEGEKAAEAAEEIPKEKEEVSVPAHETGAMLVKGLPASPGIGSGPVKMIHGTRDLPRLVEGDVLVTRMTNPDMVPAMRKANAIVTEEGGLTCHAAIVSRELGIPCVVGASGALKALKEGMMITVDGTLGTVTAGKVEKAAPSKAEAVAAAAPAAAVPITGTKVYVNLGVPDKAEEVAALPVDGVGLMREEFILATYIGEHPLALIAEGNSQKFVDALAEGAGRVARAFFPRPVVLRLSDFKTNEYRGLRGGEKFEPREDNPMIGWRGCSRYISKEYEPAFRLELRAVKKVREEMGFKNLWVMLPFVRTVDEVRKITKVMEEEGIVRGLDLKLWLMAEVPSIIFLADEFSQLCDGFSIGSNDLTQLILGADRDSEIISKSGLFDERNEAVLRAIKHLIDVAHANGKTVSICGQAPSTIPGYIEKLIRMGIDSVSVNPDAVLDSKQQAAAAEMRILIEKALKEK